jgi:hypothetical protein
VTHNIAALQQPILPEQQQELAAAGSQTSASLLHLALACSLPTLRCKTVKGKIVLFILDIQHHSQNVQDNAHQSKPCVEEQSTA